METKRPFTRKIELVLIILLFCVLPIFGLFTWRGIAPARQFKTSIPVYTPTRFYTQSDKDNMILKFVPGGNFDVGRDKTNWSEGYHREINVDSFWIDWFEVTNGMYALCVKAGSCHLPEKFYSATRNDYYYNPEYATYPVIFVSWQDASYYCAWAGRRLPTEAEWEKAARGTDKRNYPWGNKKPDHSLANFLPDNYKGDTTHFGAFPDGASPYGALDMAGNVWEWVADWYAKEYYYYQESPSDNPKGPANGTYRVLRGGGWDSIYKDNLDVAARKYLDPTIHTNNTGFRCATSQP